jgi:hypothetical protein
MRGTPHNQRFGGSESMVISDLEAVALAAAVSELGC